MYSPYGYKSVMKDQSSKIGITSNQRIEKGLAQFGAIQQLQKKIFQILQQDSAVSPLLKALKFTPNDLWRPRCSLGLLQIFPPLGGND